MAFEKAAALFDRIDRELWIVTAAHAGRRGGLVATFVSQASIVPSMPRVLVGLAKCHATWPLVEGSNAFALHLIDESNLDLVWRFGLQSGRDADKIAGLDSRVATTGSPLLSDVLAWLECRVEARFDTGDRTLYLAEVADCEILRDGQPLTLRRLVATAPLDKREALREQMLADAARDAEAIGRFRAAH